MDTAPRKDVALPNQQAARVYQIYDALRTLLLNKKYYAARLQRFQNFNLAMELLIAVGATGSGVAGLAVWQMESGKLIWGAISGVSVVLAVLKPLFNLSSKVAAYAKLYGEYTSAFTRMKILVDDLQVERELPPARIKLFTELRARASELAGLGDPSQTQSVLLKLQEEVIVELPIDGLWVPAD